MTFIQTPKEFQEICLSILEEKQSFIALDTEFIREKTYWPEWSTLQIATASQIYVIDILSLDFKTDFEAFKKLLTTSSLTKVFHACRQDIEIFFHDLGVIPTSLFDCQIAAAFCGFKEQSGLSKLSFDLLGIELPKTQQHTHWLNRPLSDKQMSYAIKDVETILNLYMVLSSRLKELGRENWIHEEQALFYHPDTYLPPAYRRGGRKMTHPHQILFQELWYWREKKAQHLNYNRSRILSDLILEKLTLHPPETLIHFADHFPGVSIEDMEDLWDIIAPFKESLKEPLLFPSEPPLPPYFKEAFENIKELRQKIASDLHLSESFLSTDSTLKKFILGKKETPLHKNWRYEVFGQKAMPLLSQYL